MGGRIQGELSQSSRAIKRRQETANRKAAAGLVVEPDDRDDQLDQGDQGGPSKEPIGVDVPAKRETIAAEQKLPYLCGNCDEDVTRGDDRCPACGLRLLWDKVE